LENSDTFGGASGFPPELLTLWRDPKVMSVALRLAGALDLAEDIVQAAVCAVARVKHPERIDDLRAYLIKVMKHEAYHLYALHRTTLLEEPERAGDPGQRGTVVCGLVPTRPVDDIVCSTLLGESLLERFAAQRESLLDAVPARSDDPVRYRTVIRAVAERVLRDGINGEPSQADANDAFRAAYPEYFNEPGAAVNTCHQRFRRAREDVKALLQAVVHRAELT
jgi:DNA-directed RNA polymerase specialized sigma24 family protein